jgi:transposase
MSAVAGRHEFWNDYRRQTVRALIARGVEREMIAQRLGIGRPALRDAILRYRLDKPEPDA